MDFAALAREALPPAHFGYIATGVDDDRTVARNHDAFSHYEIRAHRFNDVSQLDTATTVLGTRWTSPLYLSAVSAQRAFHAEGELATARAAKTRERVGCGDCGHSSRRKRATGIDNRLCTGCHVNNSHDIWRRGPMYAGLDVSRVTALAPAGMPPRYLDRLRAAVKVRLIFKGIMTGEAAATAVEHGADAVIISNHGGRNEETLRAPVDCLPEVVAAVKDRLPVLINGGIRRGTDVFKALAPGATGVGIGRPQVWRLAAFGQQGVEAVIDIFRRELTMIMRQVGTPTIASITSTHVLRWSG